MIKTRPLHRRQRWLAAIVILLTAVFVSRPQPVDAHPLGNFSVNRYSRLEVAADQIALFYVVDMAEIPVFQLMGTLDSDGDKALSPAEGDVATAVATLVPIVERLPLPEFAIMLGEFYLAIEQPAEVAEQFELVRAIQKLNAATGQNVDLEMARFEANHGSATEAVRLAQAAYRERPTVYAADTLAWSLYRQGDFAAAAIRSDEARRLGTQDASLFYRGGIIALANGDVVTGRHLLREALALNPAFNILEATQAQAALAER